MIDLHTHTFSSDGELVASELIRRALVAGYTAIAITDHGDESCIEDLVQRAVEASRAWSTQDQIRVLPGIEITHVPPSRIQALAARARALGAALVVVHGETITEPVAPGTNAAAVRCPDVDILAHPGLITPEDAKAAAQAGIHLEITTRRGHSAANGHVAAVAAAAGAGLVVNSDAHGPGDLMGRGTPGLILRAAGLTEAQAQRAMANSRTLLERALLRAP